MAGTKAAWTPERRARQREIIRKNKPWLKSTGPRTPEGKAVSSQNARMSPELARIDAELKRIHATVLVLTGRQRYPRMPKIKTPFDT